jgi:hypothetical protein
MKMADANSRNMSELQSLIYIYKSKSKGLPRQAEVPQGVPGRLRPRIFLMFRHYKGSRSSARRTGRLYPMRNPWYSLSETESTSGHMVLSGVPRKKFPVTPPGIDPGTSRLVAQCLNHYATPGSPYLMYSRHIINIKLFYDHPVLQCFDYNIKTIQVVSLCNRKVLSYCHISPFAV